MSAQPTLEGTWEEILTHASELSGHKLRLFIVPDEGDSEVTGADNEPPSTAGSLLAFAGTWVGNDLEDCLQSVYDSRVQAEF